MMNDGAMDGIDHVISLHVISEIPVGKAGFVRACQHGRC
jgi:metal-dependent amidase/aminoacylase/carboxypeptidase family protein